MKGGVKAGVGAPRESRSFTFLLVLQLILVAVLVAVQYPTLLARAAARLGGGGKPMRGGRGGARAGRGLKPGMEHAVVPAAASAAEALPPDTVWTPQCQLPEDKQPGHGPKSFVDIGVSSEFSARSRRDAIRAGYGKYARELGMRVRFFVGEAEDAHGRASRDTEAREFGDMVVLRMQDTYENLTLKSMGMACVSRCRAGLAA